MEFQRQRLLQEAVRIGDQLLRQSVADRQGRYWKTVDQSGKEVRWEAQTCLYNGVSGIALFLLTLYQHTQEDRYRTAALEALVWVENQEAPENETCSLLTGRLSKPFAWLRAHHILGDHHLLTRAVERTHQLLPYLASDTAAEYINGIAGTVTALLHLHAATQDERILQALDRYVAQLLSKVHYQQTGIYWDRSSLHIRGLCGFSHGASGVGYVFLELGHYFQNPAFFWIAEQAFRYERAYYQPHAKNWLDFRKSALTEEDKQAFSAAYQRNDLTFFTRGSTMNAWCHGAAGIGLSRLRAYERLGKLVYHDESLLALEKTEETDLRSTEQATFTLCHGRGGNADLFLEAFQVLNDVRHWHKAQQVAESALHARQREGMYRSGTRYEGEDLSLFNGNAGIGYFYLRVLFPRQVPSILAPKLTDVYSNSLNSMEFPSLSLSQAEVQERLLERRFPRTVHLLRHLNAARAGKENTLFSSETSLYQRTHWQDVVVRQANLLPSESRVRLTDAWTLEDARAALDEHVASDVLLEYKQRQKAKDAERLLLLDDQALAKESLHLDPDIVMMTTSWNWSRNTAPDWESNLQQPAGDYTILLIPTVSGVYEQPLNAFVQTLLEAFEEGKTVADGMQVVRNYIADPVAKLRAEALMLQQIRSAIRACLLIVPEKHPLRVTALARNHSFTTSVTF